MPEKAFLHERRMMRTVDTEDFRRALHLAKLMPLGKHSEEKKQAVKRWHEAVIKMLANNSN